jgi:DNA-binding response OmpR family regulator
MTKIALVEDDAPIREMYEMKLKAAGYEVRSAEDGEKGLELIRSFKPELILLDLRMPVMDGVEMLRQLRSKDWGNDILVLVLTNVSSDEAPMELRMLKVEKYIVKAHYTPKQVLEIIAETLSRHNKN